MRRLALPCQNPPRFLRLPNLSAPFSALSFTKRHTFIAHNLLAPSKANKMPRLWAEVCSQTLKSRAPLLVELAVARRQLVENYEGKEVWAYLVPLRALDCVPGAWEALGRPTEGFLHITVTTGVKDSDCNDCNGHSGERWVLTNLTRRPLAGTHWQPALALFQAFLGYRVTDGSLATSSAVTGRASAWAEGAACASWCSQGTVGARDAAWSTRSAS